MAIATPPSTLNPDGESWRAEVESSPTAVTVTALLVVQDPSDPRLAETFMALAEQEQRPERLVVIDATPDRSIRAALDDAEHDSLGERAPWRRTYPNLSVVVVPPGAPFAEIVDTAVEALPGPGEELVVTRRPRARARKRTVRVRDKREWLWLLHEDSAPGPGALRALMREAARSDRVGIAGCKVVEAARPDRLVNVGIGLTRTGRHVGAHVEGEPDQGQHDDRRDVLSVSSAGMLVRRDVYLTLGGFDPAFDGDGDGLDLCWRTHLLGYQVVVIPAARVQQQLADAGADTPAPRARSGRGDADRPRPRSGRTLRRHRQVALARCSLIGLPFAALWVALSSAFLAVLMLLLKRPRRALAEAAQATAPLGVGRILGARARFRGRGATRRRHLDALFVPSSVAVRDAFDAVRTALTPEPDPDDPRSAPLTGPRRSALYRALTHPGLWLTAALTAVTLVRWRPLIGTGVPSGSAEGLTGGQLRPFATDAEGIWRLWRDQWAGSGLGEIAIERPFLPVLALLARVAELLPWVEDSTSGATVVAWLLIFAAPLSGVTGYLAGRAATKAPWPRATAALVWGGLATLTTAAAQGRIGPVVVHILLPLALAGVLTVARRRAGAPSTFGTVLVLAVVGAFVPAVLALLTVVALGVLVLGRGWARARALVVMVGPWALLGPWTAVRLLEEPRALLAGPGALTGTSAPEPWQLALAHPGGAGSYVSWWTAPFLALGVLALLTSARGRVRVTIGLGLTALLGLGAALAGPHVAVTATSAGERTPWTGTALDLMVAALLGLALVAFGPAYRRLRDRSGAHRSVLVGALVAVLAGAAAVAGTTSWQQPVEALTAASARIPGVAEHMAHGARATRMLTLEVGRDGAVSYRLDGREAGAPARDLDVPEHTEPVLDRAVQAVLTADIGDRTTGTELTELAIGFVGVTGPGDRTAITRSLAGIDGVSPMASGQDASLWRVRPPSEAEAVPVSRLRITADGTLLAAVPMDDPNARTTTTIPDGPPGRVLQIAQPTGWAQDADVTLNGTRLERQPGAVPTYALPERGGELVTGPSLAFPVWRWGQALAVAGCVFLAIPFGNARSRRRA